VPTGGVLATGFANASNTAGKAVVRGTTNANAVIRPARRWDPALTIVAQALKTTKAALPVTGGP